MMKMYSLFRLQTAVFNLMISE